MSITSWEIKGWPSITSLLWVDQMIHAAKGKVVLQGMCGRLRVTDEEVAISLSQSGRFDIRKPGGRVSFMRSFQMGRMTG